MQSLPSNCPICEGEIIVTRLYCRDCDSTIEGRFMAGHFEDLTPEQLTLSKPLFVVKAKSPVWKRN